MSDTLLTQVIGVVRLVIIGVGLTYSVLCVGGGVRQLLRKAGGLGSQSDHRYGAAGAGRDDEDDFRCATYFLVPCLNEEAVIGNTVRGLLEHPNARVIVIDDDSDDRTIEVARAAGGDAVVIHERKRPDARLGKGQALNDAFAIVRRDVERRGLDPDQVLVCVMDADGQLSVGGVRAVAPRFDDPAVGGAQLAVRIRNKGKVLTTFQDFEFWGLSATAQFGRISIGTVSLGGNGQFTRLTALLQLDGDPWSSSLTEELDLAITLPRARRRPACPRGPWHRERSLRRTRPHERRLDHGGVPDRHAPGSHEGGPARARLPRPPGPAAVLVDAGQHPDLVDGALEPFGLTPDVRLAIDREDGSLTELAGGAVAALGRCFREVRPDVVVVQGDTASTLTGALAA